MISPITWLWNIRHKDLIDKARKIIDKEFERKKKKRSLDK